MQFVKRHAPFGFPNGAAPGSGPSRKTTALKSTFRLGIRLRRLRNRIAEQAPSPGGNLPSSRYLTHDFYSLRRWTVFIIATISQKSRRFRNLSALSYR